MDWKEWMGKRIFLRTRFGKVYSGTIKDVAKESSGSLLFIIDKFGKSVMVLTSDISEIKEEGQ